MSGSIVARPSGRPPTCSVHTPRPHSRSTRQTPRSETYATRASTCSIPRSRVSHPRLQLLPLDPRLHAGLRSDRVLFWRRFRKDKLQWIALRFYTTTISASIGSSEYNVRLHIMPSFYMQSSDGETESCQRSSFTEIAGNRSESNARKWKLDSWLNSNTPYLRGEIWKHPMLRTYCNCFSRRLKMVMFPACTGVKSDDGKFVGS